MFQWHHLVTLTFFSEHYFYNRYVVHVKRYVILIGILDLQGMATPSLEGDGGWSCGDANWPNFGSILEPEIYFPCILRLNLVVSYGPTVIFVSIQQLSLYPKSVKITTLVLFVFAISLQYKVDSYKMILAIYWQFLLNPRISEGDFCGQVIQCLRYVHNCPVWAWPRD